MGVRVRLSKNSSAYFPFWLAIPFYTIYATLFLSIAAIVVMIWLAWACIALPIAAIASLSHNKQLSQQMTRSLIWKK